MRFINQICKDILNIDEKDLKTMWRIAEDQQQYISPLKLATQAKQNNLGRRNGEILDKLVELRKLIKKNNPEL